MKIRFKIKISKQKLSSSLIHATFDSRGWLKKISSIVYIDRKGKVNTSIT